MWAVSDPKEELCSHVFLSVPFLNQKSRICFGKVDVIDLSKSTRSLESMLEHLHISAIPPSSHMLSARLLQSSVPSSFFLHHTKPVRVTSQNPCDEANENHQEMKN